MSISLMPCVLKCGYSFSDNRDVECDPVMRYQHLRALQQFETSIDFIPPKHQVSPMLSRLRTAMCRMVVSLSLRNELVSVSKTKRI